ncbi:MAG: hypothetical protein RLZZ427_956 [Pseudomonadota bacterium]
MKKIAYTLALLAPLAAQAAETGNLVRFVSCPVYRDADSGKKSGCWLTDNRESGERFDISLSPYKPDWNRAVLVEGRVSGTPTTACGGVVLDPVRTSVLDQPCERHMLPAEGYPGRKFVLPLRNTPPTSIPRTLPAGPFAARTFAVFFEFDRSFMVYQYSDYLLDQAILWLTAAKPKRVIVTGFAANTPETVSGQSLAERPDVAQERADLVSESLRRMLPDLVIETRTELAARPADLPDADGLPGQSQRRVEIRAEF